MNQPFSISGDAYDWQLTKQPERPYLHAYHQTLVDKIYLATKPNPKTGAGAFVHLTFEQALERIRQIDQVTRGIPKITYLVGWQYDGHDSKYPDWGVVNPRLKRSQDATARDSLIWLFEEARQYHTTVSLHINMLDAYEDAPSWQEYLDKGLLVTKDGELYRHARAVWGGQQAFWVDYAKEWEAGLAQRRIDRLLEMLPIQKQGTIHIDAMGIPLHTDIEAQKTALRKIMRYWRDKGVDLTSENQYDGRYGEGCVGLQPMAWHLNPNFGGWKYNDENPEISQEMWMKIPPSLCCGGVDWIDLANGGLFGSSMQGETIQDVSDFIPPFCLQTLPWYFVNRFDRLSLKVDGTLHTLTLSGDVVATVDRGYRTIRQGENLLVDGKNVFVPALWQAEREIIAFSQGGYPGKTWNLPENWSDVARVDIYAITKNGLQYKDCATAKNGKITLDLTHKQAVSIVPAGAKRN